jgi:prepilin-type N-terminal cleavage/methylation domain-containing protein
MRRTPLLKDNQRGDTIVEVLIALAVIGSVLVGAFVVTTRSTTGVRDSEEHAQAMQLLQGQVEQLRSYALLQPKSVPLPTNFCFTAATPTATSTPACNSSATEPIYKFLINRQTTVAAPATSKFKVTVTWNSVTGSTAQETMYYKVAVLP